MANLYRRNTK